MKVIIKKKFMKSKDKDQDKHQEELEKTSEKIDSVDEHRDILSRVFAKGRDIQNK
jgi:hypothetical protein